MRLTAQEVTAIKKAAAEIFGGAAVVRVFGSRLDDARRGGDIDLHVQLSATDPGAGGVARFRGLLDQLVGEREYDIVIAQAGGPLSAISRKAIAEGEVL